jgi:hypothetical protein
MKIKGDKMKILHFLAQHPSSESSYINKYILCNTQSKKTTSAIYRTLNELISDGYIQRDSLTSSRLLLTKNGWNLLNFPPMYPIVKHIFIPRRESIKIIIHIDIPWNEKIKEKYHLGVR